MSLNAVIKITALAENALKGLNQVEGSLKGLANFEVGRGLTDLGDRLTQNVTQPIVGGLTNAFNQAVSFESAMAGVNKVISDAPPDLADEIERLSFDIPIAAEGLAAIAQAGGQLGVDGDDIIEYTELVSQMGTAFEMLPEQAGENVARMQNALGLDTLDRVREMGDLFNHLSDNSAALAKQMVDVAVRTGGVQRQFGLAESDIAALTATFIEISPSAEVASTSINSMLTTLQTIDRSTPKSVAAMESLGISASDMVAMIERDAMGGIQAFIDQLSELDGTARAGIIRDIFGTGADSAAIAQLAGNTALLGNNLETVANNAEVAGSMLREAGVQSGTTGNRMVMMKNRLDAVSRQIGEALSPAVNKLLDNLEPVIEFVDKFIEEHPGVSAGILAIAGGLAILGPALMTVGMATTGLATIATLFGSGGALAAATPVIFGVAKGIGAIALSVSKLLIYAGTMAVALGLLSFGFVNLFSLMTGNGPIGFQAFIDTIKQGLAELPANLMQVPEAARGAFSAFVNIARLKAIEAWNWIKQKTDDIVSTVTGLKDRLMTAGANAIQGLIDGITSKAEAVAEAASTIMGRLTGQLPGSPVKEGPLTVLNNLSTNPGAKIMDMLSAGMMANASSLQNALSSAVAPALNTQGLQPNPLNAAQRDSLSPSTGRQGSSFNAGGITVNYNPQISLAGGEDTAQFSDLLRQHTNELRDMLQDIVEGDRRVGYVG